MFSTITLNTSPASFDLTDLASVKLEWGITSSDEDATLAARITQASKLIAGMCDRAFAFQNVTEIFHSGRHEWDSFYFTHGVLDGRFIEHRSRPLELSRYPIVSIDSITVDDVAVDPSEYTIDAGAGLLFRPAGGWYGVIAVTYSGGYQLPDQSPPALAAACSQLVQDYRLAAVNASSTTSNIRELAYGDRRISYFNSTPSGEAGALSPTLASLIAPFRRVHF